MYSEIKKQFKQVIDFSQGFESNVDELFENWYEAKKPIIQAFGGKLIYEVEEPVHFSLGDAEKKKAFNTFVNDINNIFHNRELVDFLNANDFNSFYQNTVHKAYEADNIKVPIGMKMVKAFKFFEKDEKLLEQFQQQASRIIQEDKIEGKLCFSVHPLDFLSTSNNTYNWRSCHALDGEFRAGNLSYMTDTSTIICYLKGADGVDLPMFPCTVPWNSKKWRMLMFISEDKNIIFASKQYPFAIPEENLELILSNFLKVVKAPYAADYTPMINDYVTEVETKKTGIIHLDSKYIPMYSDLVPLDKVIENGEGSLQFNDLLTSSTYHKPYYSYKRYRSWYEPSTPPKIIIGKEVKCLCCGKKPITCSEVMTCTPCAEDMNLFECDDDRYVCDCCGASVDEYSCVQGEIVCDNCFDSQCFTCDRCGEDYFNEDLKYDRRLEEYICTHCYNVLRGEIEE